MKQAPSLILLKTVGEGNDQRSWNFTSSFEVGRGDQVGLLLRDISVSRRHAEIFWKEGNWQVRELGSRNGTFLNGVRVSNSPLPIKSGDQLEVGTVSLRVEIQGPATKSPSGHSLVTNEELIETVAHPSMEKILTDLAPEQANWPPAERKMFALFRAASHLETHQSEEELIDGILEEALKVLDAQRGTLVLLNGEGELELRAVKTAPGCRSGGFAFSRHMAHRCLQEGMSILCSRSSLDKELQEAASVMVGEMNSILCVLLRTPRKRLGVLHLDRNPSKTAFTYEDLQLADALAASVSAGLESAQLLRQQQEWFLATLATLVQAAELHDPYTAGHAQRVTQYSLMLGKQMNLSPGDLNWLKLGTPLHDIGKIGIADGILNKPGPLTREEFIIMQSHTVKGEEMLRNLITLTPILPIVRSHHERWDGKGYPDGHKNVDIPFLARVVAVADTFDAITTDRPYRKGLSFAAAAEEIRRGRETQFDPQCAEAFFAIRTLLEDEIQRQGNSANTLSTVSSPMKETRRFPIRSIRSSLTTS